MRHYGYGYRRAGARKALGRLALLLLLLAHFVAAALGVRLLRWRGSGQVSGRGPGSNMILKVMAPVTGTLNSKS